jgi:diguanylate cyclase (GGDEF)-like protein/PAS domain S-box-containing protein
MAQVAPSIWPLAWLATQATVTVLRLGLALRFRSLPPEQRAQGRWRALYLLGAGAAGTTWGALVFFVEPGWPVPYQSLVYALLAAVSASALSESGNVRTAYLAFVVPCLLPIAMRSLTSQDPILMTLGALAPVYAAALASIAGALERALERSFALSSERARLIALAASADEALRLEAGERRRVQNELAWEKELAQVTLHSISEGVVTTEPDGRVDYLNPAAEELTGWPLAEARGRPLAEVCVVLDPATREPITARPGALEAGGQGCEPLLLRRRSGEECAVTETLVPILNRDGDALGSVLVFHDVTETRALAHRLAYQTSHDAVTGLLSRREFETRLAHALELSRTDGATHICLYMDLDQFKIVNDTCGHAAGDEMLRQLAALMQARLRESDALARLGGDEFGVLLEGCPLPQGAEIAEALRATVRDFRFVWEQRTFEIGVSIGIVAVTHASESVGSILSAADVACYAAKDLGRNRIHVYEANDLELARRHGEMQWVSRITQALAEDRLVLFYQDIVAVEDGTGTPHSVEILVRMLDEQGELVPPGAFLPAAERYNLMPAIDRWVVQNCFRWLSSQPRSGRILLGINLSGTTLSDDQFLPFIREQFERCQVPPPAVCFEITETAAIANLATASRFIRELRELGCRFALDDFGSGLSSFAYLKNLPVDYLKIDGGFVRDMLADPLDRAMVAAINQVGHIMGIRTIAEFVESRETLHALAELGVDYAQGWALGRPQPLAERRAPQRRGKPGGQRRG